MLRMLVLLFGLLAGSDACAGVPAGVPAIPRFRILGVVDELPSSGVNAIVRDHAGYVWLGTADGLARYDGVGFRVWRHVPGDPRALPGNNVQALHVDAQDRLWVATEFGGVSVLDATRTAFRHFRRATHPRMGSDDAWAFASRGGALWFGTADGGLHRIEAGGRITRWTTRDGLPSDTVLALAFDATGRLWIGTDAGLARWDGAHLVAVPLPGPAPAPMVYSLGFDGATLVAGTAAGVLRHAAGKWTRPAWSPMFERPNALLSLARDADGGLWLGSQRGLWRVPAGGLPQPVALEGRPLGKPVMALLSDHGGLWAPFIGRGLGHLRSDWRQLAQVTRSNGLQVDDYRTVAPARDGGVWVAGIEGMAEHIRADGEVVPLPQAGQGLLEPQKFSSVAEDREGRLWLGGRNGLFRVAAGRVDAWSPQRGRDAVPDGLVDLLRVAPDGTLWLSVQGGGVQQRDAATGAVIAQALAGEDPALGQGDTEALAFDAGGRPWIAGGMGLARWDALHARFSVVPATRGARVHAFDFDGPDDLWLHRVTGLEHYRRDGDRWQRVARVAADDRLPAIESAALRVDARHRVWLSTRRGLFCWDPAAARLQRWGVEDGLVGQEFLDRALALTPSGTLVATAAGGSVLMLDTRAPPATPVTPALRIEGLDARRSGRWQRLSFRGAPALRADDHEWRVQLRLLSYDAPAAARYWTKLDGFDRGWVAHDRPERVFTGLPAGRYVLHARAVDGAGGPAREQRFGFRVLPPWWRSGWMAALAMLLAALVVWRVARNLHAAQVQREALAQVERDHALARAASQAKSDFLATFGHEVRTPMTGVLGMAELLLATPLAPAQRAQADAILGAGRHLLRLVDDALDLARIEAGRLALVAEAFDPHALLADVHALFAPLAQAKGLAFACDVDSGIPRAVLGDAHRVRQVLLNLCGNAVKFTAQGGVRLRATPLPHGVCIEVEDTGPGLDAAAQARLFRRFEQADGARTAARHGGSGLGLAICRELAQAMGGGITVRSAPGQGAVFRVELPLAAAAAHPSSGGGALPETGTHAAPATLLLVEDDALVAQVACGLLQARGHAVTHAPHALAALAELQSGRYDLALLDLDLPGMDGLALARLLRALGHRLPLLALTARAEPGLDAECAAAGMDGFLRKPVEGDVLARAVARLREVRAPADPPTGQRVPAPA